MVSGQESPRRLLNRLMIIEGFFSAIDVVMVSVVLWISLLFIGGYVDDPENFIIPFFVAMLWVGWRFIV